MLPLGQFSRHLGLAAQRSVSSRWERGQADWQSEAGSSLVAAKLSPNRLTKCSETRRSLCLDYCVHHGALRFTANFKAFVHNCTLRAQVGCSMACRPGCLYLEGFSSHLTCRPLYLRKLMLIWGCGFILPLYLYVLIGDIKYWLDLYPLIELLSWTHTRKRF